MEDSTLICQQQSHIKHIKKCVISVWNEVDRERDLLVLEFKIDSELIVNDIMVMNCWKNDF